jgi:hypothetical protein
MRVFVSPSGTRHNAPLYVTGKLSNQQKAEIERALPNSKELRDEIALWKAARVSVQKEAAYSLAGHPTSEQIVDYARGWIADSLEKSKIEEHLRSCKLCSMDYETIKLAFVKPAPNLLQRMIHAVKKTVSAVGERHVRVPSGRSGLAAVLRPIYALPLIALLIVSSVLIYKLSNPTLHPISFALQFQTQDRAASAGEMQTVFLSRNVDDVNLSIPIPHAALLPRAEDVAFSLSAPGANVVKLGERFLWSVGNPFDSAKVVLASSVFQTSGTYILHVTIKYTPTSLPFEYSYWFKIALEE